VARNASSEASATSRKNAALDEALGGAGHRDERLGVGVAVQVHAAARRDRAPEHARLVVHRREELAPLACARRTATPETRRW
jgi:hypothetical protein